MARVGKGRSQRNGSPRAPMWASWAPHPKQVCKQLLTALILHSLGLHFKRAALQVKEMCVHVCMHACVYAHTHFWYKMVKPTNPVSSGTLGYRCEHLCVSTLAQSSMQCLANCIRENTTLCWGLCAWDREKAWDYRRGRLWEKSYAPPHPHTTTWILTEHWNNFPS